MKLSSPLAAACSLSMCSGSHCSLAKRSTCSTARSGCGLLCDCESHLHSPGDRPHSNPYGPRFVSHNGPLTCPTLPGEHQHGIRAPYEIREAGEVDIRDFDD